MPLLSLSVSQLLLAFVSASILHKLTFNRFFIKWLASCKFTVFLTPTNHALKKLKDRDKDHGSKKGRHKNRQKKSTFSSADEKQNEVFHIPTADLEYLKLDKTTLNVRDLELITCSVDLEWIVDLALMSIFSLTVTEVQFFFYPQTNECNFSLLWALLVIIYCIKTLWKLTATYFKNEQSIGERSICIISGCFFLLIAMVILIGDEKHLELGLESAYRSFNESATAFVKNHSLSRDDTRPTTRPISFILVKFSIAIICALIGVVFTFPGLRFGQLYKALLDKPETSRLDHVICNLNYLSPLFIVCLWIKPLARKLFTHEDLLSLDDDSFDTLRIYCIIFVNIARFFLIPQFVTIFLASANNRVARIRCRGGNTTNKEIQVTVSSIYNYVNVVTIQYILPILMCIFTGIMFKTLGGHNWLPPLITSPPMNSTMCNATATDTLKQLTSDMFITDMRNLTSPTTPIGARKFFSISTMVNFMEFKKIFSTEVFRGIFGFATWWLHFSWFCASTAGVIYHTYFIH